jgi:hypothetical protein
MQLTVDLHMSQALVVSSFEARPVKQEITQL